MMGWVLRFILLTIGWLVPVAALATQARSLPLDVLRQRALRNQITRVVASEPKPVEEEIQFTILSGRSLSGRIKVPAHEKGQRLPVVSVFGGFQHASSVIDKIKPNVPVILASFDYPFEAPRTFEFPGSLKYAPEAKRAITDMLDAIDEFHRVIKQRDDVDPARLTIIGASFGAPFALAAAANDASISGVALVHGFGDLPGAAKRQLARKWQSKIGPLAQPFAWVFAQLAWIYLDGPAPERSALRLTSRQRVLLISAEHDTMIGDSASNQLWKSLDQSAAKTERVLTPGDHVQSDSEDLIREIGDLITKWMMRADLL